MFRILILLIFCSILEGIILSSVFLPHESAPLIVVPKIKINNITNQISSLINRALPNYIQYCKGNDEFRPISLRCLNNYGVISTVFESLEATFLLNMEIYGDIRRMALDFNCKRVKKAIRSDYWERMVASLIGVFLLSNDHEFLKKADECATISVNIDSKTLYPLSIISGNTGNSRIWENGTALDDIAAGLSEMYSLYAITKKERYYKHANNIYNSLPKPFVFIIDPISGSPVKNTSDPSAYIFKYNELKRIRRTFRLEKQNLQNETSFIISEKNESHSQQFFENFLYAQTKNGWSGRINKRLDMMNDIQESNLFGSIINPLLFMEYSIFNQKNIVLNSRGHLIGFQ